MLQQLAGSCGLQNGQHVYHAYIYCLWQPLTRSTWLYGCWGMSRCCAPGKFEKAYTISHMHRAQAIGQSAPTAAGINTCSNLLPSAGTDRQRIAACMNDYTRRASTLPLHQNLGDSLARCGQRVRPAAWLSDQSCQARFGQGRGARAAAAPQRCTPLPTCPAPLCTACCPAAPPAPCKVTHLMPCAAQRAPTPRLP